MLHLRHRRDHETEHQADHDTTDEARHAGRHGTRDDARAAFVAEDTGAARERFGGVNLGACFFGWLVAIGLTALLTGIIAAVASAVGYSEDITQAQAEGNASTIGLVSGIVLLVVLLIGYYAGGYVAGRMSRFDGARQGVTVWVIGLVVTLLAAAAGWIAGDQYDVLARIDLPRIPLGEDTMTWAGVITGLAVLIGTLLAAMAGGSVGHRYHDRVDREVHRTA